MSSIEEMIQGIINDVNGLKDNDTSPEIFDAIKVPEQMTISVTDSLLDITTDVPGGSIGTSIVGYFEIIGG